MCPRVYVLVDEPGLATLGPSSLLGDEWPLAREEVGGRYVLPFHRGSAALDGVPAEDIAEHITLVDTQTEPFP